MVMNTNPELIEKKNQLNKQFTSRMTEKNDGILRILGHDVEPA